MISPNEGGDEIHTFLESRPKGNQDKVNTSSEIMDEQVKKYFRTMKTKIRMFQIIKARGKRHNTSEQHPFVDLEILGIRRSNRSR